jgi:hypothetical protein
LVVGSPSRVSPHDSAPPIRERASALPGEEDEPPEFLGVSGGAQPFGNPYHSSRSERHPEASRTGQRSKPHMRPPLLLPDSLPHFVIDHRTADSGMSRYANPETAHQHGRFAGTADRLGLPRYHDAIRRERCLELRSKRCVHHSSPARSWSCAPPRENPWPRLPSRRPAACVAADAAGCDQYAIFALSAMPAPCVRVFRWGRLPVQTMFICLRRSKGRADCPVHSRAPMIPAAMPFGKLGHPHTRDRWVGLDHLCR